MNTEHTTTATTEGSVVHHRTPSRRLVGQPVRRRYSRAQPATLLRRAAHQLQRCGWMQGQYWDEWAAGGDYIAGDRCCALGALAVAAGVREHEKAEWAVRTRLALREAVAALADTVRPALGDDASDNAGNDVAMWNDWFGRTSGEVVTALFTTAQRLSTQTGAFAGGRRAEHIDSTVSTDPVPGGPSAKTLPHPPQ